MQTFKVVICDYFGKYVSITNRKKSFFFLHFISALLEDIAHDQGVDIFKHTLFKCFPESFSSLVKK